MIGDALMMWKNEKKRTNSCCFITGLRFAEGRKDGLAGFGVP